MRVVFVDDDVNALHAMRRSMRDVDPEWALEFLPSATAALESLAHNPADVIVTDMRMPGMDGWQLLEEAKTLCPKAARLVLSGYTEPGAILKLVGTAHQYLAKPGDSSMLKAAIAQTQSMRDRLKSADLAQWVGNVGTLPVFPKAFEEIASCLRKPNTTVADAARIMERDTAMTADILSIVNSAFFGSQRRLTSLDRIVAHLGLDSVVALVLGHGLFHRSEATDRELLWKHSLETGLGARAIARAEHFPDYRVEEAFLAGILHDIGRLVFSGSRRWPNAGLSEPAPIGRTQVDEHHTEVGGYLLSVWGFPSQVVSAVALHHTPCERVSLTLDTTVLVHVADRLARAESRRSSDPTSSPSDLGIEPGLLESLGVADRLPRWRDALEHVRAQNLSHQGVPPH